MWQVILRPCLQPIPSRNHNRRNHHADYDDECYHHQAGVAVFDATHLFNPRRDSKVRRLPFTIESWSLESSSTRGLGLSSIVCLWLGMNQHAEQFWSRLLEADLKVGDDVVDARQW